ncbi:MAG TPA: M36 family metallopeptidase [Kofleriaceae bacterium]|nr:M36 family metallopeptidase [Kofleriaceae bacterium]
MPRSRSIRRLSLLAITSASLLGGCDDPQTQTPVATDGIYVAEEGAPLTGPSAARAREIVTDFLRTTGRGRELATLDVTTDRVDARSGRTHVRLDQRIDGVRVVGGYVKATLGAQGELLHVIDRLVPAPSGSLVAPRIDDATALAHARAHLGIAPDATFHRAPTVERIAYVDEDGALRPGFLVETWQGQKNLLHHTIVDGGGKVFSVESRTNGDSYRVFVEDPGKGGQTVVSGGTGWLGTGAQTTHSIGGNNVRAYLDTDNNNAPDAAATTGATSVTDGNFLATANLAVAPTTAGNRAVAVQNLFYLNNRVHDALYAAGFDEAAGNFQASNFGLGGAGNDAVNAEAQDGGGTDNANFATPADGSAPRMQMYLWTGVGPDAYLNVAAPASVAGRYDGKASTFGGTFSLTALTGAVVLVNDGSGTTSDGCETLTGLAGKIALIDRGTCDFTVKVLNAQKAGAIAAIVANNTGTTDYFAMGGTNRRITIPSLMVGLTDGATLRSAAGVSGGLLKETAVPLQIDGDIDADIVFHEYGHGLTWRMIGGMSGPIAGAIGEGGGDTLAMLLDGDAVIGEYAYGSSLGIRRYSYEGYPLTYAAMNSGEVHNDGELYAAIMWKLLGAYLVNGRSADDLLADWVDSMNYIPSTPSYENMRDGLLQAVDSTGDCWVWQAYAAAGVGQGSKATVKGSRVTITQSFVVPAGACQ